MRALVLSCVLVLGLGACQTSGSSSGSVSSGPTISGFLDANSAALPVSNSYTGARPPVQISSNPRDRKVIVYSHGTSRPQQREDCSKSYNRVPDTLTALDTLPNWDIFYLCSVATDGGTPGSYIYKRKAEILSVVDEIIAAGVPPQNIFLAGHSAGAWSSLMAMDAVDQKFNAAILFAPACCGPRSEESIYPVWRTRIRPRQVSEMTSFPEMNALIFAFSNDRFNRPQELGFLSETFPESVTVVVPECGRSHGSHLSDCNSDNLVAARIRDYLAERTGTSVR
jgi:pimeloyl-ACP methyl ester carboxylesterase